MSTNCLFCFQEVISAHKSNLRYEGFVLYISHFNGIFKQLFWDGRPLYYFTVRDSFGRIWMWVGVDEWALLLYTADYSSEVSLKNWSVKSKWLLVTESGAFVWYKLVRSESKIWNCNPTNVNQALTTLLSNRWLVYILYCSNKAYFCYWPFKIILKFLKYLQIVHVYHL